MFLAFIGFFPQSFTFVLKSSTLAPTLTNAQSDVLNLSGGLARTFALCFRGDDRTESRQAITDRQTGGRPWVLIAERAGRGFGVGGDANSDVTAELVYIPWSSSRSQFTDQGLADAVLWLTLAAVWLMSSRLLSEQFLFSSDLSLCSASRLRDTFCNRCRCFLLCSGFSFV